MELCKKPEDTYKDVQLGFIRMGKGLQKAEILLKMHPETECPSQNADQIFEHFH